MRILGGVRGNTADGYFRIAAPFSVLRYSTPHQFEVRQPALGDAQEFDVLWLQRFCEPMAEIVVKEFKDAGKLVIYDVDDWLFGMPPSWSCFDNYYRRGAGEPTKHLIFHERLMRLADVVTCPAEYLAQKLRERLAIPPIRAAEVPGWENPPPVHVLPNCVLQGDWDTILPLKAGLQGPIVGWFGMEYHWDNWKIIAEVMDEALEFIDGNLVILGFPEVVACFPDRLAKRTHVQPAVSWSNFAEMRSMIGALDVGIAWLEPTDFNHCKSPLKAFQYGAAGVPVVASQTVYGDLPGWWTDGDYSIYVHDHGITVDTKAALNHAIRIAVTRIRESRERAEAWQEEVWQNYSYERQAWRWRNIIELYS